MVGISGGVGAGLGSVVKESGRVKPSGSVGNRSRGHGYKLRIGEHCPCNTEQHCSVTAQHHTTQLRHHDTQTDRQTSNINTERSINDRKEAMILTSKGKGRGDCGT